MPKRKVLRDARTRNRLLVTLLSGLLAVGFIVGVVAQHGDASGLIGVGPKSPAHTVVIEDMPDAVMFTHTGFDGALFYAIARHPFEVKKAAESMDFPTYRLRRILLPFTAGVLVPGGGSGLIYAMAAISTLGVMLGAWWLGKFPRAPGWLPLMAVINPGVILALTLTLSDALATGLVLAAFGAMFSKRVPLAVVFLVLACLTRETSVIAAFCLAAWPGISVSRRAALAVIPAVPIGAWSLYVAVTLGDPLLQQHEQGTFGLPFVGWFQADFGAGDLTIAFLGAGLCIAALTRRRRTPLPVSLYLAATLAMLVCAAPIVAETWFGTGRVIAVAFPLAIWALSQRNRRRPRAMSPPARRAGPTPESVEVRPG